MFCVFLVFWCDFLADPLVGSKKFCVYHNPRVCLRGKPPRRGANPFISLFGVFFVILCKPRVGSKKFCDNQNPRV